MNIRPNNSFDKFKDLLQLSPKNNKVLSPNSKVNNLKHLKILAPDNFKKPNLINKLCIKISYKRPKLTRNKSMSFKPDTDSIKDTLKKVSNKVVQI